jgi:transcriptional regulator with XRE-family HTH domain
MSNSLKALNKRVWQRIEELQTTLKAIGEKMGTGHGQISRYLNGHTQPQLDSLDKLAEALGVSTAWLISEDDEIKAPEEPLSVCVRRVSDAALNGPRMEDLSPPGLLETTVFLKRLASTPEGRSAIQAVAAAIADAARTKKTGG